jgi:hypothetical protein
MEQGNTASGNQQIHRNTVGDGDREQHAGRRCDPAVDTIDVDPPPTLLQNHELDAVNLIAESDSLEFRHFSPEGEPAAHHFAHRLVTPEAQVKPAIRLGAATSDARDDSVTFKPTGNFESGYGSRDGCFSELR